MNIAIVQGRPTKDPVLRQSERTGRLYLRMYIAVEGPYRGPNVPRITNFIQVICFDKLAQTIYNNVAKGALLTVLGTIGPDKHKDEVGNEINSLAIFANKITIHEWLRKHRPLEELKAGFDDELIPREITDSLYKQIDIDDEDIPDDLMGGLPDDLL